MKTARKVTIIILLSLSVMMLIGTSAFLFAMTAEAKLDKSKLPSPANAVVLLDKDDAVMDQNGYVTLDGISPHIRNAFIAVEDKRFYNHFGLDGRRILGALVENVKNGGISQGGSTIENQLIKNTHLTNERTLKRKLQEAKITLELEKAYSKDQILEMYLNVIYFGKGIYGVSDACRTLYGKKPNEVSPLEAASLAATIANPSKYSPLYNREKNAERAKMVLALMRDQGYISTGEYNDAKNRQIVLNYDNFNINYSRIYINSAFNEAKTILSKCDKGKPYNGCMVFTYYDKGAQDSAFNALFSYTEPDRQSDSHTHEIMISDNLTRGVVAYVSDNNDIEIKRQPGSLLKPFIYAKAIENGELLPDTPLLDEPIDYNGYSPTNYGNVNYGWISARNALSASVNTVAVGLLDKIGVDSAYQAIEKAGINLSERDKTLSLALGGTTFGSTVKEISEGYQTLANYGRHKSMSFVRKITDKDGKVLYDGDRTEKHVFSSGSTFLTIDMMRSCAQEGTAKQLKYLPFDIAAKTGTVACQNGNSDAWCAAITTKHTFVCRFSATDTSDPFDNGVTGGNLPTKVIRGSMKTLYSENLPADFIAPNSLKRIEIDRTIKEDFHKLVPYKNTGFGEKEIILGTNNYRFDTADPEKLLLGDLSIEIIDEQPTVSFRHFTGVEYDVLMNGSKCDNKNGVYHAAKQRFPIGKLEIYCKKNDRMLWKTTRLVRLY